MNHMNYMTNNQGFVTQNIKKYYLCVINFLYNISRCKHLSFYADRYRQYKKYLYFLIHDFLEGYFLSKNAYSNHIRYASQRCYIIRKRRLAIEIKKKRTTW